MKDPEDFYADQSDRAVIKAALIGLTLLFLSIVWMGWL